MNKKPLFIVLLLISLLTVTPSTSSGRSIITGQVVDAETGKPIEGAAVYIYWYKMGEGPPGLAGYVDVEVAEMLSEFDGKFKVPKYSTWSNDYTLVIYHDGYVCWSSNKIFPSYEERKGFRLKNGMIIKLELFKNEYSRDDHARFTESSSVARHVPGLFNDAIIKERELYHEIFKRK